MVVFRLWRGNSQLDGEYSRVIEDVNRGRFYELVAEYKMTEGVTGGIDIERIK